MQALIIVEWHICPGVAIGALGFTLWIMHQRVEQGLCKDLFCKKQFIAIRRREWGVNNNQSKTVGKQLGNWPKNTNSKTNYVPRDMEYGDTHIQSDREKGHAALNIQGIMTRLGQNTGEQSLEERRQRRHQVQPSQEKQCKLISSKINIKTST